MLGLILNLINFKLSIEMGLATKMMMSMSGKEIFILVRGDELVLKSFAEKLQYLMEVSIGSSDLISLQPCDRRMIPFRYIQHN